MSIKKKSLNKITDLYLLNVYLLNVDTVIIILDNIENNMNFNAFSNTRNKKLIKTLEFI